MPAYATIPRGRCSARWARHRQAYSHGVTSGECLCNDPAARGGRRHRHQARQPQLPGDRDHRLSQERRHPREGGGDGEPCLDAHGAALRSPALFGIGSYKTAWLLLHKLRRAMVSPDRSLLQAMVETDETEVPLRSKHDPIKGYGIPNVGKLLIIGAVELSPDGYPRRVRLAPLRDRTGENVRGFVERVVARDATVVSDGLATVRRNQPVAVTGTNGRSLVPKAL
jgi:hypothetical protein